MKETPKIDPSRVTGGLLPVPCTNPPYVPTQPPQPYPLPDPINDPWTGGPDRPYEGPTF